MIEFGSSASISVPKFAFFKKCIVLVIELERQKRRTKRTKAEVGTAKVGTKPRRNEINGKKGSGEKKVHGNSTKSASRGGRSTKDDRGEPGGDNIPGAQVRKEPVQATIWSKMA